MYSLSLVNLLLLINKFSFICEGQSCRVRITTTKLYNKILTCQFWTSFDDMLTRSHIFQKLTKKKQKRATAYKYTSVIKWKHFPRYWPFVWGIHRSLANSPHKGQWRGALIFSLICAWIINGWVNNREVGDLGRHCAHYDTNVVQGAENDEPHIPTYWMASSYQYSCKRKKY